MAEHERPEHERVDEAQPDQAQPDQVQPDEVQSDGIRSDETRPDEVQPDEVQPDEAQPDDAQLGDAQPDATQPDLAPSAPASEASGSGMARTVTVISLRVVRGLAGMAAAVAVIAAVGLVPLPTIGVTPLETIVEPEPADLLALCPGSALRLGDETGADAARAFAVGEPRLTIAATGQAERESLEVDDAAGGSGQAPTLLRLPPAPDAVLAAAQAQSLRGSGGLQGLAVAGCAAPTSSAWLVGGATTLGRTTLLLIANPTEVEAEVEVHMWGESGAITSPGMTGITVPAGGQRALSLAGFAPDVASPVVHVQARGGQVVAALQTSVTRVLDPGGVDLVSAGVSPARDIVIPAVRIADAEGIASSLGFEGYEDLEAAVRIGNPGEAVATVQVSVTSTRPGGPATSFPLQVPAGAVLDTGLTTALALGAEPFPDGSYTVVLRSDVPVVAAVRASTISTPTVTTAGAPAPGAADLAWFASASGLTGDVALAVAEAPSPELVVVAVDAVARTLVLSPIGGGEAIRLEVPAVGSAVVGLEPGAGYMLSGAGGAALALSFAGPGEVAGYPIVSPRAADSPLVVRP